MENNIYLRINLVALSSLGVWPIDTKHPILNRAHRVYCVFVIFYFCTFVCTEYIEVVQRLGESIFEIANNLGVSFLYSITVMKIIFSKSAQAREFVRHIFQTEAVVLGGDDVDLKKIFIANIRWNHNLNKVFITITLTTLLPFFINPLLVEYFDPIGNLTEVIDNEVVYKERAFPFRAWLPFDKNKYYHITFSTQVLAGILGGFMTCMTDIFIWGLMIFGIGQIKMLQYKLRNLKSDGEAYAAQRNISFDDGVFLMLRKCVMLHQIIIQYVFDLDRSINVMMFMDFVVCSLQIGVLGFQIIIGGFGLSEVFTAQYLLAMLVQMFLFYWHANEIILESLDISKAIWTSEFYEYTLPVQKCLQFIMMRAQKPLTLHVGPFYTMSTTTALLILRAGYSYVALIKQVYT